LRIWVGLAGTLLIAGVSQGLPHRDRDAPVDPRPRPTPRPRPAPPAPLPEFAFSQAGEIAGLNCISVNEPSDPHAWSDNFFCSKTPGFVWSVAGPVAGRSCVQITEPSEPPAHTWNDNYLCAPTATGWELAWSFAGPLPGFQCSAWHEQADPHTWSDNHLCYRRPVPACSAGNRDCLMSFGCSGSPPPKERDCISVDEPADPDGWADNILCAPKSMGLRWSYAGKIAGMRCLQITEPAEPAAHAWTDNYLCQTPSSPWELAWSYAGPLDSFLCERWNETADAHTWGDNFLCVRPAKVVVAAANTRTFELQSSLRLVPFELELEAQRPAGRFAR